MYSNRKFNVIVCSSDIGGSVLVSKLEIDVETLLHVPSNNDNLYEWEYSMKDIADTVLDLKLGESMYFQPNRDDKTSKGIIFRIS